MDDSTRVVSGPLQTERQNDGRRQLLRELVVQVDGLTIPVPANTLTDYSSIPSLAAFIVRWSRVDIAGVVHDQLYHQPQLQNAGAISRRRADRIWYLVAIAGEHRANTVQAWLCWLGLRIGGWRAWNRLRRAPA